MLERAKENGILLVGQDAGIEMLEKSIEDQIDTTIQEFWSNGGVIKVTLESCDCVIEYSSRESFPTEDTPCNCGKNMFVKYKRDVAVIDLSKLRQQQKNCN